MNIIEYVKKNWAKLPKSNFDGIAVVIVEEVTNEYHGYGHHSYEGFGILKSGISVWCFSSGCSCNGSVNVDHLDEKSVKVLECLTKFEGLNPEDVNFQNLKVSFQSY